MLLFAVNTKPRRGFIKSRFNNYVWHFNDVLRRLDIYAGAFPQ